MSRFDDEAFSLEGLNAPAEALPPGDLVERDQALRFRRLRGHLFPRLTEETLWVLEGLASELHAPEESEYHDSADESGFGHREDHGGTP